MRQETVVKDQAGEVRRRGAAARYRRRKNGNGSQMGRVIGGIDNLGWDEYEDADEGGRRRGRRRHDEEGTTTEDQLLHRGVGRTRARARARAHAYAWA